VLVAGVLSGLAFFGAHPFHVIDAPTLSTGVAVTRVLAASGFTLLCMLSIAAIAFALGLWLPRGAAELGTGELAQVATVLVAVGVAVVVLLRRDPAA
jgi:ABC-2 type transport system permease protein